MWCRALAIVYTWHWTHGFSAFLAYIQPCLPSVWGIVYRPETPQPWFIYLFTLWCMCPAGGRASGQWHDDGRVLSLAKPTQAPPPRSVPHCTCSVLWVPAADGQRGWQCVRSLAAHQTSAQVMINPRRACATRVTVVVPCVCLSVCYACSGSACTLASH